MKKLFAAPCRTVDIYKNQLARWGSALDGEMAAIENAMARKLRVYQELQLDHLPLEFKFNAVPIVIMNRIGVRQSGICWYGVCIPINLFGVNLCLRSAQIDAFYLRMEKFVFYKSRDCVYRQSLDEPGEARCVITNCTHFISRGHNIFLVTNKDKEYCNLRGDGHNGFVLDKIYCTSAEIIRIDFDLDHEQLLILKSDSLSVFYHESNRLVLLQQFDEYFDCALFHLGHGVARGYSQAQRKNIVRGIGTGNISQAFESYLEFLEGENRRETVG